MSKWLTRPAECQVQSHESGSSAARAYAAEATQLSNLASRARTSADVEQAVQKQRDKVAFADVASAAGDLCSDVKIDQGEDEVPDVDMAFSDMIPSAAAPPQPPQPESKNNRKGHTKPQPAPAPIPPRSPVRTSKPKPAPQKLPNASQELPNADADASVPLKSALNKSVVTKAEKVWSTKGALVQDASLWEGKLKKRQVEDAARQLEENASKLLGDTATEELMNNMLTASEMALKKWELFGELRKNPDQMVLKMPEDTDELWRSIPSSLAASIMAMVATHVLKDLDQDWARIVMGFGVGGVINDIIYVEDVRLEVELS